MNAKKTLSLSLASAMALGLLAGCGSSASSTAASTADSTASAADSTSTAATADAAGKVYYLNFKPEQDEAWQDLAAKYTEETGVPVTVVTAASGQYETTLMSEMAKSDAPTLFQVNGPVGLASWKDYCYDLSGSKIAGELTSDSYALKDGDATLGIGYVIESYGLITNKTLLEKAGYSVDDINATLDFIYWCVSSDEGTKAMADDMGFVIPFKAAAESPNLFVKVDNEMTAEGKTPVAWNFSTMPSENWKNGVGSALTAYAAGTGSWDDVVTAFVDGWASEAALNAAA